MTKMTNTAKNVIKILKNKDLYYFLNVLGNQEILEKFIFNIDLSYQKPIDNEGRKRKFINSIEEFFEEVPPQFYFAYAFSWSRTNEGDEFWRKKCNDWRNRLGFEEW